MKTLYIIRHAESSLGSSLLSDFDRPLNEKGFLTAPKMAQRLVNKGCSPRLIISSPANRAVTTAECFADKFDMNVSKIKLVPSLYLPAIERFYEALYELDADIDHVFIFSHNPGVTEFANDVTEACISSIPAATVICIKLNVNSWDQVISRSGEIEFIEYPDI